MTKDEKIKILTDNTKTDAEIASILGLSQQYLSVLRTRWKLSKKRGNKPGSIKNTTEFIECKVCGKSIKKIKSRTQCQYCSRECMYRCHDYIAKLASIDKSYMKSEEYSLAKSKPDTTEYKMYLHKVQTLTRKTYALYEDEINPLKHPRRRAGVEGAYHLDHIISIRHGFDNDIPPDVIAHKDNLQMMPWRDNIVKGKKIC